MIIDAAVGGSRIQCSALLFVLAVAKRVGFVQFQPRGGRGWETTAVGVRVCDPPYVGVLVGRGLVVDKFGHGRGCCALARLGRGDCAPYVGGKGRFYFAGAWYGLLYFSLVCLN
jgi:hypothetical protein